MSDGDPRDATLDPAAAMPAALATYVFLLAIVVVPFQLVWRANPLAVAFQSVGGWLIALLLVVPAGIVIHEALHALVWAFGGSGWSAVRFGIAPRSFMVYAHYDRPLSVRVYRWGAALPGIVMGVLPSLVGLIVGSGAVAGWGAIFLGFAAGDILVLAAIRGVRHPARVLDHPTRAGCRILEGEAEAP